MDITNPVIGFLKDFGPTVWRYVKYQICHNNYVSEFQKMQKQLKDRKDVIEAHLRTAVLQRGKIENTEVRVWLDDAQREIAEEVIEDLICKGGCFTYICSSRKLDKKTQALCKEMFERGERYTNGGEILVMDDHSIEYRRSVFEDMQKEVEYQKEKIEADLKTQLIRQPGKTALKGVKDWLEKASRGGCSSSTNIEEKIQELNRTLEEGEEFTNVGVSLVIDDHSKRVPMPAEKCIARDEVQEEILQLLRGDKVTRIAVCGMCGVGKTLIMKQVHNQLLKEPTKEVIWVKVSKDFDSVLQQKGQFDILKFQKSIARKLGCGFNEDEDVIEHAKRISQSLQQRSYVLIVDDVCEPFSLEAVGILDSVGNDACKLVLTTQLQKKFAREMRCKEIYVKPLSDDGALALFWHKVDSDKKSNPIFRSDIEPFLNQILKNCNGLPPAIIEVATDIEEKMEELKQTLEGEKEFTSDGVSLVIDDHSIQYCARVFEEKQKQLKYQKEKIEADLKTQLRQPGKIVCKEVEDWLEKASQQIAMEAEDLISQGECSSSTNIEEKTEELKRILEKGKEFTSDGVSLIVDDHSKKGVTMLAEKCIARDDVQEEILQLLRGDKVTRIAVCGMGGVGKTTIMKQVHNQLLKEPTIKKVIWVKVSKDFDIVLQQKRQLDIIKFQKNIARKLGFDLNEDEDAVELAGRISQSLQQGSCVLILDDVWEPFSLEDVGILDSVGNDACKLVLTTRLQQRVARELRCTEIYVKPLLDGEALALFLDKVESDLKSHPRFRSDIEPFFNQILKKCNGLPLAIGVVAKTMRGKFDRYSWVMADKELSKSEEIVDRLKFSYDHLEEQYKKCFLYCALYPENHEIPKEELIEFWIDEGFIIDERGFRDFLICAGHVILDKLIDNCMLELVKGKRGLLHHLQELVNFKRMEHRVSMHDLLREMALKISPQFMVKAGMALEELPEEDEWTDDLLKVSLMNNNIREIPSSMSSPKCPMLTTLLLSNNKITTIPEAFFDQMLGLKILDLSNNYGLGRLPSSVFKLKNLTTLLLENCKSLKEVPSLSNLGGLKRLNLFGTSIEELPEGLCMLTNLKCLWLDGKLSDIPDKLLGNLSKLQYFKVGWTIPLKLEGSGRLRKLESLDGRFSTLDDMRFFVKPERKFLQQYKIFVGSFKDDQYDYDKTFSEAMKSVVCCDINLCEEPNWLPSDAQGFYIKNCKDVRSLDDIFGFQEATDLRHCTIWGCDGLEFVVSSRCLKSVQNLESLCLKLLKNLNAVFGEVEAVAKSAPLPAGTFSSLQEINVFMCGNKIKKLLPLRLLRYLQNLRTIGVSWSGVEEIIWSEYEEEKALENLTLPKLEELRLIALPLKSIYSGSTTVLICDSLKRIEIGQCSTSESVFWAGFNPLPTLEHLELRNLMNLKCIFDEEVLGLSALPTTSSLKTIVVNNIPKLKKVFSSGWLLGYFQSLETIHVSRCDQMEELISSSTYEEKEAVEEITLPNLQRLELKYLSKLMSICSNSSVLICDSIKSLDIRNCNNLKRIPLHLSSLDNGQPPSLREIRVGTKERWESLEWVQSNAKDVLLPSVKFDWGGL